MYFSMQFVKVVCSEDEMEEPGFGMARSKQCSLTFCNEGLVTVCALLFAFLQVDMMTATACATYVDEEAGVLQRGLLAHLLHDFGLCVEGHFGWRFMWMRGWGWGG